MEEVQWRDDYDCWVTTISEGAFLGQQVRIETDGADEEPTPHQYRTCQVISHLCANDVPSISELLHAWTAETCDVELLAEYREEDYEFEIEGITIPKLREIEDSYFLAWLRCELDPEHGIGLACRGGTEFAICHPETYYNRDWDDSEELNAPFS